MGRKGRGEPPGASTAGVQVGFGGFARPPLVLLAQGVAELGQQILAIRLAQSLLHELLVLRHAPAHQGLLQAPLAAVPDVLRKHNLTLADSGKELVYTYDTQGERTGITTLLADLAQAGIRFRDLRTTQSSLEDIFVDVVRHQQ